MSRRLTKRSGIQRGKVGAWFLRVPAPPLKRMVAVPGWVVSTTRLVSKTNRHPRDNTPRDVCTTPITCPCGHCVCVCVTLGRYNAIYISVRENRPCQPSSIVHNFQFFFENRFCIRSQYSTLFVKILQRFLCKERKKIIIIIINIDFNTDRMFRKDFPLFFLFFFSNTIGTLVGYKQKRNNSRK